MIIIHYEKNTDKETSNILKEAILIAFNTEPKTSLCCQKDLMADVADAMQLKMRWLRQFNRFTFWKVGACPKQETCNQEVVKFLGGKWKFCEKGETRVGFWRP